MDLLNPKLNITNKGSFPAKSCNYGYASLPLPLIVNGKVQDENLEQIGQTRFWLKNQLQELGARAFKEIHICTIDHRGKVFLLKL